MTIRTLIVDDEPLARSKIRKFLESESDFVVVGECDCGPAAVSAINEHDPDLVFLDVQMPEIDGFSVIEIIGPERMPATVFVTAFDQYAVKAFDFHALDYLLKPFDRKRFVRALTQIRQQLDRSDTAELNRRLVALIEDLQQNSEQIERLAVKTSSGVTLLKVSDIHWIDAAGNYVRLNTGDGDSLLLRETMSALEGRLDPQRFVRVHRSTIVNVDRIREIRAQSHGEHVILMETGQRLSLSRSYRERIQDLILHG